MVFYFELLTTVDNLLKIMFAKCQNATAYTILMVCMNKKHRPAYIFKAGKLAIEICC